MNCQIIVDGETIVKATFDLPLLKRILTSSAAKASETYRSSATTAEQMATVLNSIDQRSAQFLREIAASDDGSVSWERMRAIFGIKGERDWAAYSGSFGKGITRAFRSTTGHKSGKLVWWRDEEWDWDDEDLSKVYVDGPALAALRQAA